MKRILSMVFVLMMLLTAVSAWAEDTGIQIIGGPEIAAETVNLDDWKVGETANIAGFGEVTLVSADFVDKIYYSDYNYFNSGDEADYLKLKIEILNTQTVAVDYYKQIDSGICTFDDIYQFGAWKRQYENLNGYPMYKKDDSFAVKSMYRGKYIVVVTLPNDVVTSKKNLSITFKIGDNEFTYHHRK